MKTFARTVCAQKRAASLSPSMVGANRSERTFSREISRKVLQGAEATTTATYAILKRVDRINPEGHDPSPQGGTITLALLFWMAFFLVFIIHDWATAPLPSESTPLWTSMPPWPEGQEGQLFTMELACGAVDGFCVAAVRYSGDLRGCAAALGYAEGSCDTKIFASGATALLPLCYSDVVNDGVYVSPGTKVRGTMATGGGTDGLSPMPFAVPVHPGRTLLRLVNTTNHTLPVGSVGHSRVEWFPLFLGAFATVPDECVSSVNATGHGSTFSGTGGPTQLIVDAEWTRIEVTPRTLLVLWGNVGGAWASSLEAAGFLFLLYHLYEQARGRKLPSTAIGGIVPKKPNPCTSTTSATNQCERV